MLGAWYWFHHILVAAPGDSVGSKDDVRVVPSPPSTAVERAGKLGVVNQAQPLILCPFLYKFAVSVSRAASNHNTGVTVSVCIRFECVLANQRTRNARVRSGEALS